MDTSLDLTAAPRETLLAIIAQQQNTIAQLQRRIEALEGKAKPGGPKGMPGIKPKSGRQQTPREKGPRKPRPHGFARQRTTPTHRVEHVLDACLQCGTGLSGGWTQRTREVIDLPVVPVQVTEHVFIARTCPVCEKRRVPKVDLGGVALGKQRLGINLLSLMAALREEGRLPFRTVQWYLRACLRSLQYVKLRLLPEGVIMSHSYSSDIRREQFARILPCLESARRRTKPRTVDLYDVFCGVLYLLKSGCQWRMLPADFPDWRTCYKYFRQWSERPDPAKYSILEQVLKKIGWRSPAKQWSERTDQLLYRGLPERQEHRQRREQGL